MEKSALGLKISWYLVQASLVTYTEGCQTWPCRLCTALLQGHVHFQPPCPGLYSAQDARLFAKSLLPWSVLCPKPKKSPFIQINLIIREKYPRKCQCYRILTASCVPGFVLGAFPALSHIWCYSLGPCLSILDCQSQSAVALLWCYFMEGQTDQDKSPMQEPHPLGHQWVSKAFFRFPAWNRWKQRGRKSLALGRNRSGQGRFQIHQVERPEGLLWGWGPSASSPEQGLWDLSGQGAADLRHVPRGAQGVLQVGRDKMGPEGGEAIPPPSAPCPVPHLASVWRSGREAKININSPESVQDSVSGDVGSNPSQSLTFCGFLQMLARPQSAHLQNGKIGADLYFSTIRLSCTTSTISVLPPILSLTFCFSFNQSLFFTSKIFRKEILCHCWEMEKHYWLP